MNAPRNQVLVAAGFFLGLTVLFTWPLPLRIGREIPLSGPPADPMHLLYGLTWGAKILRVSPDPDILPGE